MSGNDGTRCTAETTDNVGAIVNSKAIAVVEGVVESDGEVVRDEYETEGAKSQVFAKFRDDHGWGRFEEIEIIDLKRHDSETEDDHPGHDWSF